MMFRMSSESSNKTHSDSDTAVQEQGSAGLGIVVHGNERPPAIDRDIPKEQLQYTRENTINNFKLIGFYGKGSFGHCYEYLETNTNAKYAVKVIRKHGRGSPPTRETIAKKSESILTEHAYNEAEIQGRLRHRNIVELFWPHQTEQFVFLFMEPCVHGNLHTVIKSRERLSAIESRYYLRQLASGCQYLREHLVVHRDLKPKNLFIDSDVVLKIGDFGLAIKLQDVADQSFSFCGTRNYMAPEMISEEGHGLPVDMWAVGCILFELLTGETPFERSTYRSTQRAIMEEEELRLPNYVSITSNAMALMGKLLARKPNHRCTPTDILQSDFIMERDSAIPLRLPKLLLDALPPVAGTEKFTQVLHLEKIVWQIMRICRDTIFAPEPDSSDVEAVVREPESRGASDGSEKAEIPPRQSEDERGSVAVDEPGQFRNVPVEVAFNEPESLGPSDNSEKAKILKGSSGDEHGSVAIDEPGQVHSVHDDVAEAEPEASVILSSSSSSVEILDDEPESRGHSFSERAEILTGPSGYEPLQLRKAPGDVAEPEPSVISTSSSCSVVHEPESRGHSDSERSEILPEPSGDEPGQVRNVPGVVAEAEPEPSVISSSTSDGSERENRTEASGTISDCIAGLICCKRID